MGNRESLSLAQARRVALAAQGFAEQRPDAPTARDVRRIAARLGLLQIDSVNVVVRAHYMPLFSRLGAYGTALLDGQAYAGRKRRFFEYWGHEASLLPCELYPLMRWRMDDAARGERIYKGVQHFAVRRRNLIERVRREVETRGALAASEIEGVASGAGGWWGWGEAKTALEWLFWCGEVTTSTRRGAGFERVYDLTSRALPHDVLATPAPDRAAAQRQLIMRAATACGIASGGDLADYFRLPVADVKLRLGELVEAGALLPVAVEGWRMPGYLDAQARVPRRIEARALLAPFDPLVWERDRAERLFGFRYRIEIYTPAHKRVHGYYVLPFLMGEHLVARVDLKADRLEKALRVQGVHAEPGRCNGEVADSLAVELRAMAAWLGLERVIVMPSGDLASLLARTCGG